MDVFEVHRQLIADYAAFSAGFTEHVLDSFFVIRKYEERDHGEFRTKRLVLREYDAMAEAVRTGVPYRSPLNPPPGRGPRHPREVGKNGG
jgi:hypothetical protein